jgi:NTP pyrophosphatase (non-canonical NTP hydrolase)
MDSNKYLSDSSRTASSDYIRIGERVLGDIDKVNVVDKKMVDLLHASIGMQTEAAEFSDMLKKHFFYGKPLDKVNLREELGDQLWYIAMALRALDTTFESVMERNIEKLKARYPDKFTEELAENRDLTKEREILENE